MGNKTGTKFAQTQPGKTGRNESGTFTDKPFETTDYDEARKLALTLDINGVLYDWQETFGKHIITAHYPFNFGSAPSNEPPINLWELNSQSVQKDILDASNLLVNAMPAGWIYFLKLFQQNPADYIIQLAQPNAADPAVLNDPSDYPLTGFPYYADFGPALDPNYIVPTHQLGFKSTDAAAILAALIASGVTSSMIFAPQLKHTQTVNSQYPIRNRNINVGQIISTSSLYFLENIPNNTLFILPDYLNPATPSGKPVLMYGWLKNAPAVNQIAKMKFQITQTWDYGLWPIAIYGTPL